MQGSYLVPRGQHPIPVTSWRHPIPSPPLKINDPAARAMTDFHCHPSLTVTEDLRVEYVFDEMFRLGVRAFLVVHGRVVTGLITHEHARGELPYGRSPSLSAGQRDRLCVEDVMTPAADVPTVDWQMVEGAQVRDLMEIFEGSAAQHLVVVESDFPNVSRVRGLVHRVRLERRLGVRWSTAL